MNAAPIGVFDSGVGGISVLRDIRRLLPHEHLIYYADSGYCPYGGKPQAEIQARAGAITEFLLARGAKLVVVACNTATIAAVEWLRATYPVPFVGMEPAVKPAAAQSRSGVVGVLATGAACASSRSRVPAWSNRWSRATSTGRARASWCSATPRRCWRRAPIRWCWAAPTIHSCGR
jgi:glutamate racemase